MNLELGVKMFITFCCCECLICDNVIFSRTVFFSRHLSFICIVAAVWYCDDVRESVYNDIKVKYYC
jgi:hypothetical protein